MAEKRRRRRVDRTPHAAERAVAAPAGMSGIYAWFVLALALVFTLGVRWRQLDVPLDRDEGEFAYIAQQMLAGVPPYESGYAMKMPGIYVAYALSMLCFGESTRGIHAGCAIVQAISIVLLFLITRRLYGPWIAAVTGAMFALLPLNVRMDPTAAQAEHFVLLPVLLGVWILQSTFNRTRNDADAMPRSLVGLVLAGLCFGTAVMIKQHGFPFGLFAASYVFSDWWSTGPRSWKALATRMVALAVGCLIPFAVVMAAMKSAGVFDQFWLWTVTYARQYATTLSFAAGMEELRYNGTAILSVFPVLWALAILGATSIFWDQKARAQRPFVLGFFAFSFLAVCPGLYFRAHYFVFVLPAVAILAALGCAALVRIGELVLRIPFPAERPLAVLTVAAAAFSVSIVSQRAFLFQDTPYQIARLVYRYHPFPEAVKIARYISTHSQESSPIMVLGSEPEIYFYTGRRAASPHIYMYPLMEDQPFALAMQREMADALEQTRPEWVVLQTSQLGWARRSTSETWIFPWMRTWLEHNYEQVGVVDLSDEQNVVYRWGPEALAYRPRTTEYLTVLRRNDHPAIQGGGEASKPQITH